MPEGKKTLYHSEAVQLGQITVTVKQKPTKSKYGADKPPYSVLVVSGQERNYTCENPKCEAVLNSLAGKTALLQFTGSRETAEIMLEGQPEAAQQKQAGNTDAPQRPPPNQKPASKQARTPAQDVLEVKRFMMRQANLRLLALDAAVFVAKRHNTKHPDFKLTQTDIRELSSVNYIGAERNGMVNLMPHTPIESKETK